MAFRSPMDNRVPSPISPVSGEWVDVRLAATVQVNLSGVPREIDGVPMGPQADRVLLTAQVIPSQNGIYLLTGGGGLTGFNLSQGEDYSWPGYNVTRLYRVRCTGAAIVLGLATVVAGPDADLPVPDDGFVAPRADGTFQFLAPGGDGTIEVFSTTTLERVAEADSDAEILLARRVSVALGSNAGRWRMADPGTSTPLTSGVAMTWSRQIDGAAQALVDPFASATNSAPTQIPASSPAQDATVGVIVPNPEMTDVQPFYVPLGFIVPVTVGGQSVTANSSPVNIRM